MPGGLHGLQRINSLACSTNLPEGLYVLFVSISFFFFNWSQIISASRTLLNRYSPFFSPNVCISMIDPYLFFSNSSRDVAMVSN